MDPLLSLFYIKYKVIGGRYIIERERERSFWAVGIQIFSDSFA